jgi:hypothetical protein
MNIDDFEKQLQQQPIRQVPGHWRNQILQAARQVESRESKVESQTGKPWLHQLLWPYPQAWGALAAIWMVALLFFVAGSESEGPTVAVKAPVESREVMLALKQQLKFRAELMSANDTPVAEPPKLSAPQSRIESFIPMNRA